ncbi:MAG: ureidoglycolate lyase [Elusimicrobiota bacterium]
MLRISAVPLGAEAYRDYGDVISARADKVPRSANMGTAKRFNSLAELVNLRPGKAEPNLCLFHCAAQISAPQTTFEIKLLEKHPLSTQTFIPMQAERYLVVVALGKGEPDLSTLKAFLAAKSQGVTYRPGVWHHPLIAMDRPADFACLIWEDGTAGDCEVSKLDGPVVVEL